MAKNKTKMRKSGFGGVWNQFKHNPLAVVGLIVVAILVLIAIFADQIAPYGSSKQNLIMAYTAPGKEFWFGADEFGRDIFSRVVYGARISLFVGFIAVGIATISGGVLGALAGFYGGRLDNWIMRIMDVLLSIPQILLAISISASLGPGLFNLMMAVGFASMPQYARIIRGAVMTLRGQEFVEAARAVGSSDARIILKHIIPNSMAPLIVQATLGVASAILSAAGLSFIGLGIQPPTPEWGAMLSGGRTYIRDYPYMTLFPGLAIMVTILSLNFVGDGLRDALDPKLKR